MRSEGKICIQCKIQKWEYTEETAFLQWVILMCHISRHSTLPNFYKRLRKLLTPCRKEVYKWRAWTSKIQVCIWERFCSVNFLRQTYGGIQTWIFGKYGVNYCAGDTNSSLIHAEFPTFKQKIISASRAVKRFLQMKINYPLFSVLLMMPYLTRKIRTYVGREIPTLGRGGKYQADIYNRGTLIPAYWDHTGCRNGQLVPWSTME